MTQLRMTLARMRSRAGLTMALLAGLTLAVALPTALPIYVEGATARLLDNGVENDVRSRPTFAYLFGFREEPAAWSQFEEVDALLTESPEALLGLPVRHAARLIETDRHPVSSPDGSIDLGVRPLASLSDADEVMTIVEGRGVQGRGAETISVSADGALTVEAIMSVTDASTLGVAPGSTLLSINPDAAPDDPARVTTVSIVGLWAAEEGDDRWIVEPDLLDRRIFISDEAMLTGIDQRRANAIAGVRWYTILDGSALTSDDVGGLISGADRALRRADALVPGVELQTSPVDSLRTYAATSSDLTARLLSYSVPLMGLIVAFLSLIVATTTADRRSEILTLRSRGARPRQIVASAVIEAALLGLVSFVIGVLGARFVALAMGRTRTFGDLSNAAEVSVGISRRALAVAAVVTIFGLVAQVIPVWLQSRSITAHTRRTDASVSPWWQRTYLDALIVILVAVVGWNATRTSALAGDPFDDPLVVLLPAAFALAVGLVCLRLIGPALGLLAKMLERTNSVAALLSVRRLARSPGIRAIPLLLVTMTVALGTYTASIARTLDLQLLDTEQHAVGADRVLGGVGQIAVAAVGTLDGPREVVLDRELVPMSEIEALEGVAAVTRQRRVAGAATGGLGGRNRIDFVAIEASTFSDVGFWRDDYASEPLPALVDRLSLQPEAVLMHTDLADSLELELGSVATVDLSVGRSQVTTAVVLAGTFDQFPTWDPDRDEPAVVGNLEHLFRLTGNERPYDVWLRLEPGATTLDDELENLNVGALNDTTAASSVEAQIDQPARQGVFGLLSVGFVGSVVLSVAGLSLYALSTFRASAAEFGVLRAIGLRHRQLRTAVAIELGLLIAVGLATGALTGVALSRWFVPLIADSSDAPSAPLFLPVTDWVSVGVIAATLFALFAVLVGILVLLLRRLRLFEAIKLGESA